MFKTIGTNVSKNLSSKYSQQFLDHANEPQIDLNLLPASIYFWSNYKSLKKLPQNTSETVESETKIPRKRYISPEKRHKIIDELKLIQ